MRRWGKTLAAAGLASCLAGCRGVQTMLDPAADQSRHIDLIWRTMLGVCGVMYLLVLAFLAWALWRARQRRAEPDTPAVGETAADDLLSRGLTGWIALIVAGLVLLTTVSFLVDRSLAEVGPDPLRIKVTANQWWWQVDYRGQGPSENFTTANVLHLPVNRPAVIELQANDVIHSFWVPNLSGKTDLIPGRTNYMAITPRRVGSFRGQCAEFCGFEHAKMAFDVQVDDPKTFEAWRQRQVASAVDPKDFEAIEGKQVFTSKACVMCHRIQGTDAGGTVGPDLTHLMSRAHIAAGTRPNTRGDLQAWIADPQGVKPGTSMPRVALSSDELNAVVSYLETLK
ncbi:cytochrome c oxidase subunit II [Phenylobacterium soli]|uniref:cytochrome-c oxidase n=1 Tax=Phenylobacterium soli TaxID=2170551 RepID=A0A328AE84_9CAUL|nr:cytochrome c oxidase subunit II [Phenylobacterium soli]RAK53102.1 cytochrome c oxidase subunit II [Phenylobacterium soli]